MEKAGGRKSLSLTTSSSRNLRHGVFQRFSGLKFERRLKVVLLSGAMGVLGPLAAYAGSSGLPLGANIEKTAPAGSVAAQTAAACLPWDVACLLLRPVGSIPVGPPFGGPDNQSDDGGGGGGGSGGGGGGNDGGVSATPPPAALLVTAGAAWATSQILGEVQKEAMPEDKAVKAPVIPIIPMPIRAAAAV
jgi:hypothetical protein